jgi:hypothetical protein
LAYTQSCAQGGVDGHSRQRKFSYTFSLLALADSLLQWSYRTPLALHIRNKEVLYRDGDFEEGFVEINNDEDTPITVAQYW